MDVKKEANDLMGRKQFIEAKSLLLKYDKNNPNDADVLLGIAIAEHYLNNIDASQALLEKACNLNTKNPSCYLYLANILRQKQQAKDAIENYQIAISLQPNLAIAHLYLASLYMGMKQLDDAEYHYQYVITLQPDNADAYANLAQVYELSNKKNKAQNSIKKSLEIRPNHSGALMALGKIKKRDKNYPEAIDTFNKIISISTDPSVTAIASLELGHCLDKIREFDKAYTSSLNGKRLWTEIINNIPFDKKFYQKRIKDNYAFFTSDATNYLAGRESSNNLPNPIFFVGFPRSGTTLLEQILNQHNDITTSGEKPIIDNLIKDISSTCNTKNSYPECLKDFSAEQYESLREYYWSEASNVIHGCNKNKILVDKLPLNLVELGLISRIFPNARFLVALRDPRDICLSCFMQAFTPNPAMTNFLSMDNTVNFYTEVMGLWLHYSKILPNRWHQYKYEDLVDNFENTTRDIFSFLNISYPKNARDFYLNAQTRVINTPSYQDVSTPLYTRSKNRWKNYESQLAPHIEKLAPFIKKFGYFMPGN